MIRDFCSKFVDLIRYAQQVISKRYLQVSIYKQRKVH